MALLVGVQSSSVLTDHIVVRAEEESSGAARGIAYGVIWPRIHDVHDRLDKFAGCEVLTCPLGDSWADLASSPS